MLCSWWQDRFLKILKHTSVQLLFRLIHYCDPSACVILTPLGVYNNNNLLQYRLRECWRTTNTFIESCHRSLWLLQIIITLTESALLIFLQFVVEKLLAWAAGDWIRNLRSEFSDAYDLSATATPLQ